jgi:hypothetical protein
MHPDKEGGNAMEGENRARRIALALIRFAIALAVGNLALHGLFRVHYRLPEIVQAACSAFMTAEGSLLAIYIAFGSRPLPVRMAFAVPGVAVIFLPILALPDGPFAFAIGLILVICASIPSLVARIAGWQIMRNATETEAANSQPARNPLQFTLGQLFGWTLAVAMVAGLMRILVPPDDLRPRMIAECLVDGGVCLAFGTVALAAVWSTLGRGRSVRRLLTVVAITGLIPLVVLLSLGANSQGIVLLVSLATLDALLTGCGLLLLRPAGLRLVRSRRGTTTVAEAAVAVD